MTGPKQMNILITGCSSGIGRALAEEFCKRGHRVFATARRLESLGDCKGENIERLPLDVTQRDSMTCAVDAVVEKAGSLDMLVNNAGFGLFGAMRDLSLNDFRRQLETNVTGPLALAQIAAARMIEQGSGRIVNVSSVSGVLTTPFAGAYCASKAALNSLTDAMRMELAPFGIDVILVQPGGVVSKFSDTAGRVLTGNIREDSVYASIRKFIEARAQAGQMGAMDAGEFARRVVSLLTQRQVPRIIRLGANSIKLPAYKWGLPGALVDKMLSRKFGLNKLRKS